ncbi:MAG TPA: phosphatase PAP2 family protein [Urbifossiella sp.]|jgi:undecaprenyl-diphosphatase|nr:phosphatase PAP2 family protein [Urbifossiella sp.]
MKRVRGAVVRGLVWVRQADAFVLAGLLAAAAGVWVFLAVANWVAEGTTRQADEAVVLALREPDDPADPIGPRWVEEGARDLTALGGYTVLTLLVGAVLGYLVLGRHYPAALLVLVATAGGGALSMALKGVFARPRPALVPHLSFAATSSFPSGHSMLAAVTYLTLGALLARLVRPWWAKLYFPAVAAVLAGLVGASRVYLGVHYPTDVVAGWAAGLAWAVGCWLAARYLQRRGVVDRTAG